MMSYVLRAVLQDRHNGANRVLRINNAYKVPAMTEPTFGAHYVVFNDSYVRYFSLAIDDVDEAQIGPVWPRTRTQTVVEFK